ncbi:MAG: hypothetical protein ISP86_05190 [Shewanellaceae bacterium]|nr:hypothetical protein [Shewanellaceae bacterium]
MNFNRLTILWMIFASCAQANTDTSTPVWYEIEFYMFKRDAASDEKWPDPTIIPLQKNAFNLMNSPDGKILRQHQWVAKTVTVPPKRFDPPYLLSEKSLTMTTRNAILSKNIRSNHVLHLVWQQGILPEAAAVPVVFALGEDFSSKYQQDGFQIQNETLKSSEPIHEIFGYLTIYLDHYLFINLDFMLRKEGTKTIRPLKTLTGLQPQNSTTDVTFLNQIPFQQKRRVRSKEIHYFDHPYLGIIMQIRPLEEQPAA